MRRLIWGFAGRIYHIVVAHFILFIIIIIIINIIIIIIIIIIIQRQLDNRKSLECIRITVCKL